MSLISRCVSKWLGLIFLLVSLPVTALEDVTLQLKWKHQFQFAGYYAALAKGYYKEAGLNVTIKEAVLGEDPIDSVVNGGAHYGVGTSELLLKHAEGAPVVVLGVVFQHSPLALAVKNSNRYPYLHDLVGQPLMIEPNSAELFAYFAREGIPKDKLKIAHHSFDIDDMVNNKVVGMSVYTTDEPFALAQEGVDFVLYKPSVGGIDFYGDNLFTTESELSKHPKRVKAFRDASFKGWKYAMEHPDEMISLIYNLYTQRHSIEHLRFEAAEMDRLLQPRIVAPGYMHEGRWEHIADTYSKQGLLPENYSISSFLYRPEKGIDKVYFAKMMVASIIVILIVLSVLLYVLRLSKRLTRSEKWLSTIVDNAPGALVVMNNRGIALNWNRQAEKVFGWKKEEAIGQNLYDLIVPGDAKDHVQGIVDKVIATGDMTPSENWNMTKSGSRILCDWRNIRMDENKLVCIAMDITERKKMEDKLLEMAHSDALTGVANRTLFFEKLEQSILLAKRQKQSLAVLFVDLDDFKIVNDKYGHEVGDVVLVEVVHRITIAVREADILARIGGDEFALMLYNCDSQENAGEVSRKIIEALMKPIHVSGIEVNIGSSIGVSFYPDHGDKATTLLKAADQAMYQVKQDGKHSVGFASNRQGSRN